MILGNSGLKGVIGAVDDKTVLFVHGGSDAFIAEAVAAAKDPQDRITDLPGVKAVTAHLPEGRMLEYYVSVDQMILSAVKIASGFGFPVKVRIPPIFRRSASPSPPKIEWGDLTPSFICNSQ